MSYRVAATLTTACLLAVLVGIVALRSVAQSTPTAPTIEVGPNIAVTTDQNAPRNETWIAADPLNSQHLIGAVTTLRDQGYGHGAFDAPSVSFDGGNTWQEADAPYLFSRGSGDPQVAFGLTGTPYFITLSVSGPTMMAFRSVDGGRTWNHPAVMQFLDHERVAVDMTHSPYRGRVYIAGEGGERLLGSGLKRSSAIGLFHSDDDGKTFSPVHYVVNNDLPKGNPFRGGGDDVSSVQVLSDGTLVIGMGRYVGKHGVRTSLIGDVVSHDGGRTFEPEHLIGYYKDHLGRPAGPHGERAIRHGSLPEFAADHTTGQYRDRIYAIMGNFTGSREQILLTYSTDKGRTWSHPRDIDSSGTHSDDYQANVAVDDNGTVGVIFYRSGADAQVEDQFSAYFVASTNGGRTFEKPVRVSSQPSFPNSPGNIRPILWGESENTSLLEMDGDSWDGDGGDYIGLTTARGVFHPMWTDSRSGTFELYTSAIRVEKAPLEISMQAFSPVTNLDKRVRVIMEPAQYDSATRTDIIPLRLQNISKEAVTGPLTLILKSATATMRDSATRNVSATNGQTVAGRPSIDYSHQLGTSGVLDPGGVSEALPWKIHMNDMSGARQTTLDFDITGRIAGGTSN